MKYTEANRKGRDTAARAAELERERDELKRQLEREREKRRDADGEANDAEDSADVAGYDPDEILKGFGVLCIIAIFAILTWLAAAYFGG